MRHAANSARPWAVQPLRRHGNVPCARDHSHGQVPAEPTPVRKSVREAAHLLPHQGVIDRFVHHNPLHDLEGRPLRDALAYVDQLAAYPGPGLRLFRRTKVDPRRRVHAAVSDLAATFLDRGAAKWAPPNRDRGFLYFFASLEGLGFAKWRGHARNMASKVLEQLGSDPSEESSAALAESILQENLQFFGIPSNEYEKAIYSMLSELRGWSGMFANMESHADQAPKGARVG